MIIIGLVLYNRYSFKQAEGSNIDERSMSVDEAASNNSQRKPSYYQDKKNEYYKNRSLYNQSVNLMSEK